MDWNNDYIEEQQKAIFSTGLGCFFMVVVFGLLIAWYPSKFIYHLFVPEETQILISHSPNEINTIEIVKRDDFPNPTLRIYYDNKSIMKNNLPDDISIEWDNDYEATVVLVKQGREPSIVEVKFK